jgi:drug/metabolite transporter (DMT)-like permease
MPPPGPHKHLKVQIMNPTATQPLKGALFMVLAGVAFAAANAITWTITFKMGFKPQSDAFWQYAIATAFSLPFLWRQGVSGMRTRHPWLHGARIVLSVLGVQAFTQAFASGMAPWHVVALVMTSPFFVLIGAALFLGERVSANRWLAATIGFAGAMILLRPWEGVMTVAVLYPLVAAVCWGGASLITKRLTREESQVSITMWLLVLLTPINALFSWQAGFELPSGQILWLLLLAGVILYAAQHFLTLAYAAADAGFVQPFDDLKLFSNIAVSWLVLNFAPDGSYWLGMALILAGSFYLLWSERQGSEKLRAAQPL